MKSSLLLSQTVSVCDFLLFCLKNPCISKMAGDSAYAKIDGALESEEIKGKKEIAHIFHSLVERKMLGTDYAVNHAPLNQREGEMFMALMK